MINFDIMLRQRCELSDHGLLLCLGIMLNELVNHLVITYMGLFKGQLSYIFRHDMHTCIHDMAFKPNAMMHFVKCSYVYPSFRFPQRYRIDVCSKESNGRDIFLFPLDNVILCYCLHHKYIRIAHLTFMWYMYIHICMYVHTYIHMSFSPSIYNENPKQLKVVINVENQPTLCVATTKGVMVQFIWHVINKSCGPHWWLFTTDSVNNLLLSGSKPLP